MCPSDKQKEIRDLIQSNNIGGFEKENFPKHILRKDLMYRMYNKKRKKENDDDKM